MKNCETFTFLRESGVVAGNYSHNLKGVGGLSHVLFKTVFHYSVIARNCTEDIFEGAIGERKRNYASCHLLPFQDARTMLMVTGLQLLPTAKNN